jgi:hypothetical protein
MKKVNCNYNILTISILKLFMLAVAFPFFIGCEDKEPIIRDYPIIITLAPAEIDSTGATFQGKIAMHGLVPTTSYGFLWNTTDPLINNSPKVIVGENINESAFKIRVDTALVKGLKYKIRTFATYENKVVYGIY